MRRITILRDLRILLAGVGALNATAATGCAATTSDDGVTGGEQNLDQFDAGSGLITLHGGLLRYESTSKGDEFLRVGEKMKATFLLPDAYNAIAQADPTVYTRQPSE